MTFAEIDVKYGDSYLLFCCSFYLNNDKSNKLLAVTALVATANTSKYVVHLINKVQNNIILFFSKY